MDLLDKNSKEKISKVVNENTTTALRTEIARINKKETGKGIFPCESWEVKIWSNDHNPPHFHILRDNWNVSFEIESGKLYKVESQGREQKILQYMQDNVANWLESTCFLQTKLTNKENAMSTWVQLHD